jgi:hypothetical protein
VPLRKLADRLFGIDGRSLAAFRIGIGVLVLADLWTRSSALEQHYSDSGILPREAYERLLSVSDWQWSFHLWAGSVTAQLLLFGVAAVAACALIAGYRTRVATIVTWAMLVSLQARNPMVLYGADQLLRLMLFWAMFLPLGAEWPVDRRRRSTAKAQASRNLSMASAAMLLQPCLMYFFAGILKSNASWWSGEALGHALSSEMYVTPFGLLLAASPPFLSAMSRAVPWIEMLAPALLLLPWRTEAVRGVTLVLLVAFHVGMGCALRTGLFQAVVIVSLVPFLPAAFWDGFGRPGKTSGTPVAHAASDSVASSPWHSTAMQSLVALLFVYAVAWNVVGLTVAEYSARHSLSWMQEWWSEGRAGVPLSFRDYAVERQMGRVGWIGRITALHQRWDMFETAGPEMRGWPAITGTLDDGEKMSLRAVGTATWQPSASDAPALYSGTRWLVYFTYLRTSGTQAARELLPAVVTRDWERNNPGKKLASLQILFVQPVDVVPGGKSAKAEVWYDGPAKGRVRDD